MNAPFFQPSPERTLLIIDELIDPDLSLRTVAQRHGTTVAALSLWLALPETVDNLAVFHSAFSDRIRLLAACNVSSAIATLTRILDRFNQSDPADPALTPEQRQRARDIALRAAGYLIRLNNHRPRPTYPAPMSEPVGISREFCESRASADITTSPTPDPLSSLNFETSDSFPSTESHAIDEPPQRPPPHASCLDASVPSSSPNSSGPAADPAPIPQPANSPSRRDLGSTPPHRRSALRPPPASAPDLLELATAGAPHEHWP